MAVSFVTFALSGTTDSTTLNITLPTVQAGDVMILEYTHRATGTGTLGGAGGSGWTNKFTRTYNTTMSAHLYYKRCDGTESGTALTVTGLTDSCAGCVTVYRGAKSVGDPIEAGTSEENASANETHAEITTLSPGTVVVLTVANTPDLSVSSQTTATSPGALTERAARLNTTGTDTSIAHASAEKATAGATGAATWSQTNAISASFLYAIGPALQIPAGTLRVTGLVASIGLGVTLGLGAVPFTGYAPTVVQEAPGVSIEIPAGSLVYTGQSVGAAFTGPSVGRLAYTGLAPTPLIDRPIAIPAGTLTYTGAAPTIDASIQLGIGSVVLAGYAPTVIESAGNVEIAIPAGSVVVTGQSVGVGFTGPAVGSLAFDGLAPDVLVGRTIAIPAGAIVATSTAPELAYGIDIPAGTLTYLGYAPIVSEGSPSPTISMPAGALVYTGQDVGVAFTGPYVGELAFTGYAPTVSVGAGGGGGTTIEIPAGSLVYTGRAPATSAIIEIPAGALVFEGQYVAVAFMDPNAGQLVFTGYAPTVSVGVGSGTSIEIPAGSLVYTGRTPTIDSTVALPAGSLVLTGHAPTVQQTQPGDIAVPAGAAVFTGYAPTLRYDLVTAIPAGSLVITGQAPTPVGAGAIPIPAGSLVLTGHALTVTGEGAIVIAAGSVTVAGYAPTVGISYAIAIPAGRLVSAGHALSVNPYVVPTGVLGTIRLDPARDVIQLEPRRSSEAL